MTSKFRKSRLSFVEDLDLEEKLLADKLRYQYCDKNGRETNIKESSKIFHELGLIYLKRDSGKVALIQSAALLVAAKVRNPAGLNKIIQEDIEKLWRYILTKAGSQNINRKLETVTNDIQHKVSEMRQRAHQELKQVPLLKDDFENIHQQQDSMRKIITAMESYQKHTSHDFCAIMSYLANTCCNILGEPPCSFAFAAMGSLAKKEITPYSDFDGLILLEENLQLTPRYEANLEYFRWFSVIFHVVIISLGETVLPGLAIPSLNDYYEEGGDNWFYDHVTMRGIRLDGFMPQACKSPLGRQKFTKNKPWKTELIKPLDQMLLYLDLNEDLKNGYHLADMLSQTSFVYGDIQIYTQFQDRLHKLLEMQREHHKEFYIKLNGVVAEDKRTFDSVADIILLFAGNSFELKKCFYRSTTVFFTALAKFYGITSISSFEIINDLLSKDLLSEEDAILLSYAVAIGCEIRSKAYRRSHRQNDFFEHLHTDSELSLDLSTLTKMIGEKPLIDYFGIAISFQRSFFPFSRENCEKKFVLSDPGLYLVEVSFVLFQHERAIRYCKIILGKTELKHTELRTQLYFFLGASLFSVHDRKEAKKKFVESLRGDLLKKEVIGICMTGNCLDQYSRCIISYNFLMQHIRNKRLIDFFDNDAFSKLLNSDFEMFDNLLSKAQQEKVSPLLLQMFKMRFFVKALLELKLDEEENLAAYSDSFSLD